MEIQHLRYFYAVAKTGSVSEAARQLRIAQPVVSRMIKALEEDLGYPLFLRQARGVTLTAQAVEIFRHCEEIWQKFEKIKNLGSRAPSLSGTLRLGSHESILDCFGSQWVSILKEKYPELYPIFTHESAETLCRRLRNGELDAAICFHSPPLEPDLEVRRKIAVEHKVVVANEKNRKAGALSCFIGSREAEDTSTTKYPTLSKLQKIYPQINIEISTNLSSLQRKLVIEGHGISILPAFMVADDLRKKELQTLLDQDSFVYSLKLICRKKDPPLSKLDLSFFELQELLETAGRKSSGK